MNKSRIVGFVVGLLILGVGGYFLASGTGKSKDGASRTRTTPRTEAVSPNRPSPQDALARNKHTEANAPAAQSGLTLNRTVVGGNSYRPGDTIDPA